MKPLLLIFMANWFLVAGALAQGPAAIVEEVDASRAGVAVMDFVNAGRVIKLGRKGTLILGYLRSCVREKISGGTISVGTDRSIVEGGRVHRERVECDGGRLLLTVEQAAKSAVVVFRRPPKFAAGETPQAAYKVYSTEPYIRLHTDTDFVEIERLDRPSEVLRLEAKNGGVDLTLQRKSLRPGGLYRAKAAGKEVVFRVDAYARSGGPILSRLVSL